ncbi:MAG: DNA alkylation repair protein [Chloroflexota bacterium]
MNYDEIIKRLHALADSTAVEGMARFGISSTNTLGVSIPNLRQLARPIGRDHHLAQQLWDSGLHEGRILAAFVDDPAQVTDEQMERWVKDFDSWDVCDQVCSSLFDRTPMTYGKAAEWSGRPEEFVKRAGFALMAALAWHDKKAADSAFEPFFALIEREAADERNYVKKAVNWALRQMGKRSPYLNQRAIETARTLQTMNSRAARWIAADALRELTRK